MPASSVRSAARPALTGRAVLVVNPAAGAGPGTAQAVADRLTGEVDGLTVFWTTRPGEARDMAAAAAADPDVSLVVAVGGDGTVREMADGIARAVSDTAPALLAIPAGSGNSTCRAVWGALAWADVLDVALDPARSRVRAVDMLHLVEPDVLAVLGASSGFLAAVLVEARAVVGQTGIDRYHAAAANVFSAMPCHPTRVSVDGTLVHDGPTTLAAVGGGRYRAQAFQFLPSSILDDGLLDVCVVGELDDKALGEVATLAMTGSHLGRPEVVYARGRRITLERTDGQPLLAESDGDPWEPAGPVLTMEVRPGAIRMLAPIEPPAG